MKSFTTTYSTLLRQLIILTLMSVFSPVEASNLAQFRPGAVTWAGYSTSSYAGDLGGPPYGLKGMATICNTDKPGSHACSYDEIQALGSKYPYSSNAWIIDGSRTSAVGQMLRDGTSYEGTAGLGMCVGWSSNSGGYYGPYLNTSGSLALAFCSSSFVIPCCR
jgi:acyl-homoserine lactone acylase PvdQ